MAAYIDTFPKLKEYTKAIKEADFDGLAFATVNLTAESLKELGVSLTRPAHLAHWAEARDKAEQRKIAHLRKLHHIQEELALKFGMKLDLEEYKSVMFISSGSICFDDSIASQILSLYPLSSFALPQQAYDSISADVGMICPSMHLVQCMCEHMKSPVYMYTATFKLTVPECFWQASENIIVDNLFEYSFHALDMLLLNMI